MSWREAFGNVVPGVGQLLMMLWGSQRQLRGEFWTPTKSGGTYLGTSTNSTGDTFLEAICTRISVYIPIHALYSAILQPT